MVARWSSGARSVRARRYAWLCRSERTRGRNHTTRILHLARTESWLTGLKREYPGVWPCPRRRKNASKAKATRLSVCCAAYAGSGISSSCLSTVKSRHCATKLRGVRCRFQATRRCSNAALYLQSTLSLSYSHPGPPRGFDTSNAGAPRRRGKFLLFLGSCSR